MSQTKCEALKFSCDEKKIINKIGIGILLLLSCQVFSFEFSS